MATGKTSVSLLAELFRFNLYKRNQGRITRQLTAVAVLAILFFGCWTLNGALGTNFDIFVRVGVPAAIFAIGAWITFRALNYPQFADFLIAVDAEMEKVTWASKAELVRATVVVIAVMFVLGVVLFAYDMIWQWFFQLIGLLRVGSGG